MPVLLVPLVEGIATALMALLGWLGGKVIGKLIGGLIDEAGHAFGFSASIGSDIIDGVLSSLGNFFDSYLGPVITFVATPVTWLESMFSILKSLGSSVYNALYNITVVQLTNLSVSIVSHWANAILTAEHYAKSLFSSALSATAGILTKAEDYAKSAATYAYNDAKNLVVNAEHVAAAATSALAATVVADLAKAEAFATSAVASAVTKVETDITHLAGVVAAQGTSILDTLAGDVTDLLGKITAAETTAISTTIGILDTDIDKVIGAVGRDLTGVIDDVIGVAGADFPDILDWLKDIDLSKIVDLAGVVGLVTSITGVLGRYLEECGMPNCRNLSQLGRDLQALLGLVGDAGLLALFIELATNPEGGAHDVLAIFGPIADGTMNAGRSLLGI